MNPTPTPAFNLTSTWTPAGISRLQGALDHRGGIPDVQGHRGSGRDLRALRLLRHGDSVPELPLDHPLLQAGEALRDRVRTGRGIVLQRPAPPPAQTEGAGPGRLLETRRLCKKEAEVLVKLGVFRSPSCRRGRAAAPRDQPEYSASV